MPRVVVAGTIIIVAAVSAYHVAYRARLSEISAITQDARGFQDIRDRFVELARTKGAVYAYEVLAQAPLPPGTDLHLMGHAVGDILYEQRGVAGMADCTQEFRNACSHSIVIHALYEYGDGVLPMVRDACKKAPGGPGAYTMCFHGFGHGVLTYFGRDLEKTVEYCKKVGTPEHGEREYSECVGGAIMEIADPGPGIGGDEAALDRAREKYLKDPLSPCMDSVIPERVKGICLTYLTPRLWLKAGIDLGNPNPSKFPLAFSYCDAIPDEEKYLRRICYGGFGKEFLTLAASRDIRHMEIQSDESYGKVARWCELAGNEEGENACVGDAVAGLFWGGENDPEGAFRFCSMLKPSAQKACYLRLSLDIRDYTSGVRRLGLCERLPSETRGACTVAL